MKIELTSNVVRFKYNGERYCYEWEQTQPHDSGYITRGPIIIYGPYDHQCTDEGREVYEAFRVQHLNENHGK